MSVDRYQRVRAILLAALDRPREERAALIEEHCEGEASLRAEVESLLALESGGAAEEGLLRSGGLLERIAAGRAENGAGEAVPAAIGPYRIVGLLGEGGMGRVYLARQDEPIQREVAVKLVQRGLDSRRVLERFELERRVLAKLDHPGIARVLDAGSDPDGRPWFVMERVVGVPMTDYCTANALGLRARLDLFLRVCAAVHHAHQRGVLHRDLKPSNILVGTQDGVPSPKIIDFGIAKALEETEHSESSMTQEGQWLGTPDYMSPEQAGMLESPVDTRSDVYALGVILYEMLAGVRPETPALRFLRCGERDETGEPVPPSAAVKGAPTASAGDREQTQRLRRWRRELAGDLDVIVASALRTEPARRYPSVEHLADDLRRHLAGRPVLARADTWGYRTVKFVRRHRVPVALVMAGVMWLAGAAVFATHQSQRLARERDRALAAERAAHLEAETAQQVSTFLTELFEASEPGRSDGAQRTAREILDRGREQLGTSLADRPLVRARLLMTIGSVYQQLALFEPAEEAMRSALAIRRAALSDTSAEVSEALDGLSVVAHDQGRVDESVRLSREAVAIARGSRPAAHPIVVGALSNLAANLQVIGHYDEVMTVRREALALAQQVFGGDHPEVGYLTQGLAYLEARLGHAAAAESIYREAIEIQRRALGPRHPDVLDAMNGLAMVLVDLGSHAEAESLFRAGLEHSLAVHGADSPYTARALANLGRGLLEQGRPGEALPFCQRAADIHGRTLGRDHRHYASALYGVSRVELALGRFAAAERIAREVLAIRRRALGEEGVGIGTARMALADALEKRGAFGQAEAELRSALALHRRQYPKGHRDVLANLLALERVLRAGGRAEEAGEFGAAAERMRLALASQD